MIRKGVYPYEHMDRWEKSEETMLPPKNTFYRNLNMKGISDSDHEHAEQVRNTEAKMTLGYYRDTYVKIDVLIMADEFKAYR